MTSVGANLLDADWIDIVRTNMQHYEVQFDFDLEKNQLLVAERGISFYDVIEAVAERGVLLDFEHPNRTKYPNQRIFVVDLDNYTYCVPYVLERETVFMKTVFPSRKFMYLLEGRRT